MPKQTTHPKRRLGSIYRLLLIRRSFKERVMVESRVRQLTKAIQKAAGELKPIALQDHSFVDAYNSLCKVLDALNKKLNRERDGMILPDWKIIQKK